MKLRAFLVYALVSCLAWASIANGEGYERSKFRHWSDADGDGRDSRQEEIITGTVTCIVCPYSGKCISPSEADIDHVIPLRWAWDHGADQWSASKREAFANDPDNLVPVLASLNRAKGAKGPDAWLPPNLFHVPVYSATWVTLCRRYEIDCDFEYLSALISRFMPLQKGMSP